jgi:predicted nucleotidyltransferase
MVAIPKEVLDLDSGLTKHCILLGYRGSVAHGMKIENTDPNCIDDVDFLSVAVLPEDYYLGLKTYGSDGTKEIKRDEYDIVIYEIKKMIRLLSQGNPNVLSMLWLKPNFYVKLTNAGELLITNRDLFVGKHVYNSFAGYANGQLKRMTHYSYDEVLEIEMELKRRGIDPASL